MSLRGIILVASSAVLCLLLAGSAWAVNPINTFPLTVTGTPEQCPTFKDPAKMGYCIRHRGMVYQVRDFEGMAPAVKEAFLRALAEGAPLTMAGSVSEYESHMEFSVEQIK